MSPLRVTVTVSKTDAEIASQPETWRHALDRADALAGLVPPAGRVLYAGCGTSAFVAQAVAVLRERAGWGETDWAYASEPPAGRRYDTVVALTRSGTTTEVLDLLRGPFADTRRIVVTGAVGQVPSDVADEVVDLGFADEESVVQTRFPSTTLVTVRHLLGEPVAGLASAAEATLSGPLPADATAYSHFVFLARGWALGLAHEAALKMREAAQAWAESHPALDYRHGPVAAAGPHTLVLPLSELDKLLVSDIERTGATVAPLEGDPVLRLVQCQRLAMAAAAGRGLDPDRPRHLTRSVVLPAHPPAHPTSV